MSLPLSSSPFPGSFDTGILEDGNKHKPPATPEPASWGFLTVGFALLVVVYVRWIRPRSRCCGGHCHHD